MRVVLSLEIQGKRESNWKNTWINNDRNHHQLGKTYKVAVTVPCNYKSKEVNAKAYYHQPSER